MPTPIVFAICKPLSSLQYSAEWSLRRLIKDWCKQTSHQIGEPSESFNVCFVCAERRFQFSRQEIFLFYLRWRKINVVLFNVVYFVISTGPLWKRFPGTHILWSTIRSTPAFFIFDPKGRNEAQVPPPTTPFSKGGGNDCGVSQSFKDVWPLLNLS